MKLTQRRLYLAVGALGVVAAAAYIAETHWTGDYTVYFDDCQKRAALAKRLDAAGVPFRIADRGGMSLGRIDPTQIAAQLGLPSLLDVPPDTTVVCK